MAINFVKNIENILSTEDTKIQGHRVRKCIRKSVGVFTIAPIYNDFRDSYIKYLLYLPYADTIELNAQEVTGKTFNLQLFVDVRTGAIKYYLFTGATLFRTVGGQCKMSLPVSASNIKGQAMDIVKGGVAVGSTALATASHTVKSAKLTEATTKTVGEGLHAEKVTTGGGLSFDVDAKELTKTTALNMFNLAQPNPTMVNGSYSPSTNIDDPQGVYLYKFIPDIHYNEGLKANYGIPNNEWSAIGSHRGYVEINDAKITGAIPSGYKSDIMQMLQNGIYVK